MYIHLTFLSVFFYSMLNSLNFFFTNCQHFDYLKACKDIALKYNKYISLVHSFLRREGSDDSLTLHDNARRRNAAPRGAAPARRGGGDGMTRIASACALLHPHHCAQAEAPGRPPPYTGWRLAGASLSHTHNTLARRRANGTERH